MKDWNPETVEAIGVWVMRILLVIGAIVAGLMGKEEMASAIAAIVVISFFFM